MSYLRIAAIYASLRMTQADYLKSKIFGKVASYADIDGWIRAIGTTDPMELGKIIASNFVWRADGWLDYAKDPRRFLADKCDDCDGFAMFAEYVLNRLGYADVSRVYVKASSGRGHVVCVANNIVIGNWQPFVLTGSTLAQHGQQIAQRMDGNLSYAIKFKCSSYQEYVEQ